MAYDKVIVFGATGGVGSHAALTAHELGAKVVLALRDPSKPVPGVSPELEQAGGFERVQADLTQAETVGAAARQTGAKAAFVYFAHGSPDFGRGALEALKAAGVEFVVFLSSLTVQGDLHALTPAKFIPFSHSRVELALQDIFGKQGYAAVRPGFFATNLRRYKSAVLAATAATADGVVRIPAPTAKFDFIAAEDMGRVCGTLLVKGAEALADGKNEIFLVGPQLASQRDAIVRLGKVLGRDLKVEGFDSEEDEIRFVVEHMHYPEPAARQMVKEFRDAEAGWSVYGVYDEAVANIEKYGGRPGLTIQDWLEKHGAEFKE